MGPPRRLEARYDLAQYGISCVQQQAGLLVLLLLGGRGEGASPERQQEGMGGLAVMALEASTMKISGRPSYHKAPGRQALLDMRC